MNRWGDEWDWDASCETHKEAIKCLRKKKMKMVCITNLIRKCFLKNAETRGWRENLAINSTIALAKSLASISTTHMVAHL